MRIAIGIAAAVMAALVLTPSGWGRDLPDAALDKYTAAAAWDGSGAHDPVDDIAARYGLEGGWSTAHPRPAAALLLQGPLALVPDRALLLVVGVVSALSALVVGWAAARFAGGDTLWSLTVGVALFGMVDWGGGNAWKATTAALVAAGLVLWRSRPRLAGALLGVAAAVKIWPLFVLAAMWRLDRRVVAWGMSTGAALSLAGLLLPGVTVAGTITALSSASEWVATIGNITFAAGFAWLGLPAPHIFGVALGAVLMVLLWRYADDEALLISSLVVGILSSAVAWPSYWIAGAPVAGFLVARLRRPRSGQVLERIVLNRGDLTVG